LILQFQRGLWSFFGPPESRNQVYKTIRFLGILLLAYLIILSAGGYTFGADDMTEGLSYARWLLDSSLYPEDLYIQSLAAHPWNERTFFAAILSMGGQFLPTWAVILHACSSLIMLSGLYKLSSLFISSRFMRWIAVLTIGVAGPLISVGGNELYAPYLVPSLMAKGMGAWSVYFMFTRRWHIAFGLLIPVTFIQPIVGAQLSLLGTIGWALSKPQQKNWLAPAWLIIPGIWLVYLFSYSGQDVSDSQRLIQFQDFILFRMPHHFLWQQAGMKSLLISTSLFIAGFFLMVRFHRRYIWFFTGIGLGLCAYILGMEQGWFLVFKTQWLKTTIWLEALSIMLVLGWLNQQLSLKVPLYPAMALLLAVVWIGVALELPGLKQQEYHFLGRWTRHPAVDIAFKARDLTPKNALFAVPPDDSRFRYASERSIYVDFKSIAHHPAYHQEWYRRMGLLYGVQLTNSAGFSIIQTGLHNYLSYSRDEVLALGQQGIDYWLTYQQQQLDLPIVAQNGTYILYQLNYQAE
jgi:hypothetical protein